MSGWWDVLRGGGGWTRRRPRIIQNATRIRTKRAAQSWSHALVTMSLCMPKSGTRPVNLFCFGKQAETPFASCASFFLFRCLMPPSATACRTRLHKKAEGGRQHTTCSPMCLLRFASFGHGCRVCRGLRSRGRKMHLSCFTPSRQARATLCVPSSHTRDRGAARIERARVGLFCM